MKIFIPAVLIITAVMGIQFYLHEEQAKQISSLVSQLQASAKQLASERNSDRAQIQEITQHVKDISTSIGIVKSESAVAREVQFLALRNSLNTVLQTRSSESIQALRDQIDEIINSKALFRDQTFFAEEAFRLAEEAKNKGDTKLAFIYYLSAINHSPSEFRYLKAYADSILGSTDPRPENIVQLRSVLELSIYQTPPALIDDLLEIMKGLDEIESGLLAKQAPAPPTVDWEARLNEIASENLIEANWADSSAMTKLVGDLTDVVGSLQEERPAPPLLAKAEAQLDLVQRVSAASTAASTIQLIMTELGESLDQSEKAVSMMQTVEALLGQLWGIDKNGFSQAQRTQIDGFPVALSAIANQFEKKKSQLALSIIKDSLDEAKRLTKQKPEKVDESAPIQKVISRIRDKSDVAIREYENVSSPDERRTAQFYLRDIQLTLNKAQTWQLENYQEWALIQMKKALKAYRQQVYITEGEAKKIFTNNHLAEIDQRLLTPDAGQAYGDVLGKLLNKAGEKAFDLQKESAETKKVALERF